MGRRKAPEEPQNPEVDYTLPPMLSEEAYENLLIYESMNLAYKRIKNGTASAQEVCHFLKLGSSKARIENDILVEQKGLISAKTKAIADSENFAQLTKEAMAAMAEYRGGMRQDAE